MTAAPRLERTQWETRARRRNRDPRSTTRSRTTCGSASSRRRSRPRARRASAPRWRSFRSTRATGRPLPLDGATGVSTLAILRRAGADAGWRERRSAKANVPEVELPDGGRITFEPGGQIEISSAPNASLSALVARLRATVATIAEAAPPGVELLSLRRRPANARWRTSPPQLDADRYRRMLRHFDRIGPSGARMMRQTASFQVCVDGGDAPELTWKVLNALAPFMVAIFANSPRYAGRETGHRSYRRHIWATLDPRRTGVLGIRATIQSRSICDFALGAPAFLLAGCRGAAGSVRPLARREARRPRATGARICRRCFPRCDRADISSFGPRTSWRRSGTRCRSCSSRGSCTIGRRSTRPPICSARPIAALLDAQRALRVWPIPCSASKRRCSAIWRSRAARALGAEFVDRADLRAPRSTSTGTRAEAVAGGRLEHSSAVGTCPMPRSRGLSTESREPSNQPHSSKRSLETDAHDLLLRTRQASGPGPTMSGNDASSGAHR